MRKILALICGSIAALTSAQALQAQSYTVTLTLQDASTEEAVGFATVSLTPSGTTKATKYVLSDSHGKATLERVHAGKYLLKSELMGYKPHEQEVEITKAVDLGVIRMEQDREVLDAASVSAVGNPIVIKKDTVEYNASSFMTADNDALEELLKKLPGVEVDESGNVTANGETITKITIDGKTFFLDDPQIATKNLPAKIIEKVKVVKKKSEQAEFTGIDDSNEEYVIDLSVKKGMMNGMFGNAMLGGGHDLPKTADNLNDWRYQGALMMGKFTEKTQLSLILNANNTNNRGFNDLSGSMMQSMRGGAGGGRGMGRGQGGWGSGNGVTTSWMGGLNGAWTLFDGDMDLSGNYMYNNTRKEVLEQTYKETYMQDGSTLIYANPEPGYNNTFSDGHRVGFRLEHKFSENTSILVQPQLEFGRGNFTEMQEFTTDRLNAGAAAATAVNNGFSFTDGRNQNVTTRGFALFRQRLGIPGRTLSLSTNWNFSNNDINGYNQSNTHTFADLKDTPINQRYESNARGRSLGTRLVYTEPLGHNLYLEGSYSFNWRKNTSWKNTFDSGDDGAISAANHPYIPEGETKNLAYTNEILNKSYSQSAGLTLAYQEGKTRAQAGLSVNPTSTFNTTVEGGREKSYEDRNRIKWAPRAMVFYDINDNTELRLFYFGRSNQPSTNQLMAVADNSDPLNLSFGNPSLFPYFNHDLRSEFSYSNKKSFFTLRATVEGSMVQDPIVSAIWYDHAGVTYTMPVNGDNSYNGSVRMFLNWPIGQSGLSVSWMNRASYSETNSFIAKGNFDMSGYYNDDGSLKYETFVNDFKDIRDRDDFIHNKTQSLGLMERLRLTYRRDNFEVTASGRTRFNKPWYTIETANENATWANQAQSTLNWKVGQSGFSIKAEANYNWYRGYTTPRESEFIVNAEINQLVFKKQVTLALKCYDILNQAKNLSVTDATNYHSEVWNNTLGRYIIFSATWRFGNFGNAKNMRMGPGGPGGWGGGGYRR